MPGHVRIRITRHRRTATVLEVAGELDLVTCPVFGDATDAVVSAAAAGHRVVVDLTRARFVAVCGVAVLIRARAGIVGRGGSLQVVLGEAGPARATRRMLKLGTSHPTWTSRDAADRATRVDPSESGTRW